MPASSPVDDLSASEIDALAERFEPLPAGELIAWAGERWGDQLVLTCSWQKQSSILVHLVAQHAPLTRVVEIDTGLLFDETHATRARLVERYGIEVETIRPARTVSEQALDEGERLWERDPDACCGLRKVAPFEQALAGANGWLSGVRREQSQARRHIRKVAFDAKRGVVKLQPLADWTERDCWSFVMAHRIPYNALHDAGYPSIGCVPCTRSVADGQDERSGRWTGSAKSECGLHG
jgi:phosphoadenosine phosphosulfate reductase